ncbi:Hint domain-containing protein [Gimesia maris]|uniref:Hint domain-containing protein n=1 Tax=Gimesia maris TaxID=122 RepID=UPI0012BA1266|nr:Hint domain-containing protein [Gimesia maris]
MSGITRKLAIFSCLLFTGFCFWKAGMGLIGGADTEILPSAQAAMSPSFSPPRVVTTPIQQMRPGMRIVGRNPLRIQTESTIDPTPAGWRLVSVRMRKEDGTYFEAELLRPLSWLRLHQAQPGAVIMLKMPELHVVGAAEVLSISDCPPIDPGDGPVVISTFKNVSHNVLNIYVEGETEPIGVTAGHPIWSEDRQAFIHSDQLQPGERLRSAVGKTVRITSIEIRAGPEPVYNLEIAGEHVYSVTDSGLLVHNSGPCDLVPRGYYDSGYIGIVNGSADDFSDTLRATFGTYDVLPNSRLVSQADTVGGVPQVRLNKIQGEIGEAAVRQRLLESRTFDLVGEQIRVSTPGVGAYRVTDFLVRSKKTGRLRAIEVKSGGATRDATQLTKDALIANPLTKTMFTRRRARASGFPRNTPTGSIRTFEVNASNLNK